MEEQQPEPIGQTIEEALLKLVRSDLLAQYQQEKQRHREERKAIEQARKRARTMLKHLIGKVREEKEAELEDEYSERVQGEDDRHARFLQELRETIRDYLTPPDSTEQP